MRAGGRGWRRGLRRWRRLPGRGSCGRWLLDGWRAPTRWRLRWRTVRPALRRRSSVADGRPDGGTERIQAFGRALLVARRISGRKGGRRWRRAPRSGRCAGGSRSCRRRLITTPLRGRRLLRRRRVLRRLCRWCAPLSGTWRWRTGWSRHWSRRRIMWRRTLRTWCRRPRAGRGCCQRRAARQAKLAGGLVGCATPRADDHESDSRELRAP